MVSKKGCIGWLQKRTNLEKTLLSLSSLLLLTLLLMILIGITYQGKKKDNKSDEEVCWNTDCISAAGDILSIMGSAKDSCNNFYDFACGKYGQKPSQTSSVSRRSAESAYYSLKKIMDSDEKMDINGFDDMKNFYNSCVRFGSYRQAVEETRDSLLSLMRDMGITVWPIIDSLYDFSKFSREHTLASLILLDVPVVFKMEIVPDDHLIGSYLIKISPGGPREIGRSPSDIRSDVHLRSSVLSSFLLVGSSAANTDVNDILAVDSSFAAIEQDKNTTCDDVTMITPQEAIAELNRLMPEVDWNTIISEIRKASGLLRNFAVKLQCKQKIRDYVVHLKDLTERSETNYLGWRFFSKFVEHIIPTFEKSQFGTDEVVPRWRVCLELMEKFASPVIAEVLTRKVISKEIQEEVERISNATLAVTKRLVSRAHWLNDSQRSRIKEKVSRIKIRYPFQRIGGTDPSPIQIPQVEVTNFTSVVIRQQRQWMIEKFQRLSQESSLDIRKSWTSVISASRVSTPPDYTVFVYFDKIRSPYIRLHGSKWLNYGGYGVSIAREIVKVLMPMYSGRGEEEHSSLWNVWYRSQNSSTCLDKYISSHLGSSKIHTAQVREMIMQEIFLDQSSLETAYEAATTLAASPKSYFLPGIELSNEELLFLSYAQTLCDADSSPRASKSIPVKDRLNAVVMSFKTFSSVFSCEPPSSHCQIWA